MKYNIDVGNTEIFKYYCKETGNKYKLTQGKYFQIFKEYIDYVKELMMNNSFRYSMPGRLGYLYIYGYKVKYRLDEFGNLDKRCLRVDWDATKKYWKELYGDLTPAELKLITNKPKIYLLNKHSDGKRYRTQWNRTTAVFKNKRLYSIKGVRQYSRQLASVVKNNPNIDYTSFDTIGIDYSEVRKINKLRLEEREKAYVER